MAEQQINDSMTISGSWDCSDGFRGELVEWVAAYLESTEGVRPVDLDEIELRKFTYEDGVISYEAVDGRDRDVVT